MLINFVDDSGACRVPKQCPYDGVSWSFHVLVSSVALPFAAPRWTQGTYRRRIWQGRPLNSHSRRSLGRCREIFLVSSQFRCSVVSTVFELGVERCRVLGDDIISRRSLLSACGLFDSLRVGSNGHQQRVNSRDSYPQPNLLLQRPAPLPHEKSIAGTGQEHMLSRLLAG